MNRLPIRLRLSLTFALAMAVLLAVIGGVVYSQVRDGLDDTIDRELSARLAGALAIVRDDGDDLGDPVRDPLVRVDPGGYVQVLDPDGSVAGATSLALSREPLLDDRELTGRSDDPEGNTVSVRDIDIPAITGRLRVAGAIARDDGVDYTVIAGASLEQRDETLTGLRNVLLIGGPALLVLMSLAGYLMAAAALRPVERMRIRARSVSATSGERLPVPPSRDEIARLGETLNQMLERIETAFVRERSFTGDASHELRTPLTVLRAELDLALADGRSLEEMKVALESALEETDRLIALTDQLLVLARADSGGFPLETEWVDLGLLSREVTGRFLVRADGRKITTVLPPSAVFASADPLRVDQAITNLISNAINHGAGEIMVEVRQNGENAEIHVLDEGRGFPEELTESAFKRFVRGPVRDRNGTGLGLSIVAAVAESHGGEAGLRNRHEGGADVWISIPLKPAD